MIEFDVQLTKDGEMVVMHDSTVDRTTDGVGEVANLTVAEIKSLDAGGWKHPKFKEEKVPTLSEVLQIMPDNIWLNVHLKGGKELGHEAARLIIRENRRHQSFLACNRAAAEAALRVDEQIKICNMDRLEDSASYVNDTIARQAEFIQLKRRALLSLSELTEKLRQNKVRINFYGTNSPEELERLYEAGVEFVLADELGAMLQAAAELDIPPVKPSFRRGAR